MALFEFFRRRNTKPAVTQSPEYNDSNSIKHRDVSARKVFETPELLANWAAEHFVDGISIKQDYDLLPDSEARENLEITPEQRDRCLGEYSVLRVAGVSLFVKQNYDDTFWLIFNDLIVQTLNKRLAHLPSSMSQADTRRAVEEYVAAGSKADSDDIATTYMRRIYDDNPNYIRMKMSGIGNIANDTLLSTYNIFRDAYCKVIYGLPYEALKAINAVAAKEAGEA